MENFEIIQIGNKDESGLIILLPYEFKKIALMPNLKEIANDYFISDINKVYFTNEEEIKNNGNVIEILKPNEDSDLKNMLFLNS